MTGVSTVSALLLAAIFVARISAVQHPSMPPGMTHEEHLAQMQKDAEMKKRGFRVNNHLCEHFVEAGFVHEPRRAGVYRVDDLWIDVSGEHL